MWWLTRPLGDTSISRDLVMYVHLLLSMSNANRHKPNEIKGARFTTELRAGLTTFFTMAYIIAVNVSLSPIL